MAIKALLIFAHPDDETIGCGGTIAKLASDGVEVFLITATKGEKSRFKISIEENAELGSVRSIELKRAARTLGIKKSFQLDYPDGGLKDVDGTTLTDKIKEIILKIDPNIIITFEPGGLNGHPDHIAISRAASRAFDDLTTKVSTKASRLMRLYYLAIPRSWLGPAKFIVNFRRKLKYHGTADSEITNIIDISPFAEKKKEAWRCYTSQFRDFKGVRKYIGKKFFEKEHFIMARSTDGEPAKEDGSLC